MLRKIAIPFSTLNKMNFNYSIVHTERKTISIIVERDRSIVVRVPNGTTEEKVQQVIEKKKYLLFKKVNQPNKYQSPRPYKEFVSGESIMFLGKLYSLEVIKEEFNGIKFDNKFFISSESKAKANQILKDWYIEQAKEKIIPRIKRFADQLGVQYKKINIREMKHRWGSCTPNDNINFNWRLIKSPTFVIDYVIIHELAHLIVPDHSPEFWHMVSIQQPNYKKAKEWLKQTGHKLESEFVQ